MPLDVQRRLLEGSVHALVCIRMPDRRHASPRDETWLLQHQVEAALFGDNCTGAMYRLLARESLSLSPMPLKRKSVQDVKWPGPETYFLPGRIFRYISSL